MSEATFAIPGVAVGAGIAAPLPTGTRVMTGPTTAGGEITAEAPDEGIVTTAANQRKVEKVQCSSDKRFDICISLYRETHHV